MPNCRLAWTESMSVEVEVLDAEHRKAVAWLTCLETALRAEARALALRLAERMEQDTIAHFRHEEEMLGELGYPDLTAHIRGHLLAEQWMLELCRAITTDSPVAMAWLQAYKLLFVERLLVEDLKYKDFFEDVGARPTRLRWTADSVPPPSQLLRDRGDRSAALPADRADRPHSSR